jgi:hypothetical protein
MVLKLLVEFANVLFPPVVPVLFFPHAAVTCIYSVDMHMQHVDPHNGVERTRDCGKLRHLRVHAACMHVSADREFFFSEDVGGTVESAEDSEVAVALPAANTIQSTQFRASDIYAIYVHKQFCGFENHNFFACGFDLRFENCYFSGVRF